MKCYVDSHSFFTNNRKSQHEIQSINKHHLCTVQPCTCYIGWARKLMLLLSEKYTWRYGCIMVDINVIYACQVVCFLYGCAPYWLYLIFASGDVYSLLWLSLFATYEFICILLHSGMRYDPIFDIGFPCVPYTVSLFVDRDILQWACLHYSTLDCGCYGYG